MIVLVKGYSYQMTVIESGLERQVCKSLGYPKPHKWIKFNSPGHYNVQVKRVIRSFRKPHCDPEDQFQARRQKFYPVRLPSEIFRNTILNCRSDEVLWKRAQKVYGSAWWVHVPFHSVYIKPGSVIDAALQSIYFWQRILFRLRECNDQQTWTIRSWSRRLPL